MTFRDPTRITLTRRRFQRAADAMADAAASDASPTRPRRIVLTGGPGSGKSTAASFLAREFTGELWVLPESATLMYRGGMPRGESPVGTQIAQRAIFDCQCALELAHGEQHPDRVQICDRGTVDGAAYWPYDTAHFFRTMGSSHERELARYDAVIFMHTAAHLPAGYERDLEVRIEDRELAIALDDRIFGLYASHANLIAIESRGSFLDKLIAVRAAVAQLLSLELPAASTAMAAASLAERAARPEVPVSALASLGSLDATMLP